MFSLSKHRKAHHSLDAKSTPPAPAKIYRVSLTPDEALKSTAAVSPSLDVTGASIASAATGGVGSCCGADGLTAAACFFSAAAWFRVV